MIETRYGLAVSTRALGSRESARRRDRVPTGTVFCRAPASGRADPAGIVEGCAHRARWCFEHEGVVLEFCLTHAKAIERSREVVVVAPVMGLCRACGCTDRGCRGGCSWMGDDQTLCSRCGE